MTLVAAWASLLFLSGPTVAAFSNSAADVVFAVAAAIAWLATIVRVDRLPRFTPWVVIFALIYLIASPFTHYVGTGFKHSLALASVGGALVLFASFGRVLLSSRWFTRSACSLIVMGMVATYLSGAAKNIVGGVEIYSILLVAIIAIAARVGKSPTPIVIGSIVVSSLIAFVLDVRGMVGYSLIFAVAVIGARFLPKTVYWLVGILGSSAVVVGTIWYFLNFRSNEFAAYLTRLVADVSGRPATSGREWLWPNILSAVDNYSSWFGLGPGALPRDIMPTTFSSHSYYIQVYLQLGICGLVLLIALLLAVWKPLAFSATAVGGFGAAIFLMFVTHNATEVLMFQNGLLVAVPAWCAIGIGVSFSTNTVSPDLNPDSPVSRRDASKHSFSRLASQNHARWGPTTLLR